MRVAKCEVCEAETARAISVRKNGESHIYCSHLCLEVAVSGRPGPVNLRKALLRERARLCAEIESERGTKLISMVHRTEKGDGGQYITIEDSEEILDQIRLTEPQKPIDFLLHCPGGLVLPAEQIALAVKDREGRVSVIVPHYAMSGGSLVALAADEILMDPHSVLGPLDPQIQGISAPVLLKVAKMKPVQYVNENTLIAAETADKALRQMRGFIEFLLKDGMGPDRARKVAEFLTGGYMTHDTPITAEYAKSLGLPVRIGIPSKVYELLRLYRFGNIARPSFYQVPCPCLPPRAEHKHTS